jgi:uncharacterized protein (TIGR03083 family)
MADSSGSAEFRVAAFRAEAQALTATAGTLDDGDLARPSPCPPWTIGALLCHVLVAAGRIDQAVAAAREGTGAADAAGPRDPLVDARGYYRPDARFSPVVNADRLDTAADLAARLGTATAIRAELTAACERTLTVLATTPPDREIRTRHGDRMLLTEFLVTRVVELGVHGLDLAGGLDRPPWLTAAATAVIEELLLGGSPGDAVIDRLGSDRAGRIARLTGRVPLSPADKAVLAELDIRPLALG